MCYPQRASVCTDFYLNPRDSKGTGALGEMQRKINAAFLSDFDLIICETRQPKVAVLDVYKTSFFILMNL